MTVSQYAMFIDGAWVESATGDVIESINPYTQRVWAEFPKSSPADVDRAVEAAYRASQTGEWVEYTASQRGQILRNLGDLVAEQAMHLAEIETRDNGKLYAEMQKQLAYIPQWYYYFGGLADKLEGRVHPVDKPNMFTYSQYEPYGVVAAITAWNSPLLLAAYKLAPALAAANAVVLKPSEYTSCSTLEFAKLVEKSGIPQGVVNVVTGLGEDIGDHLIQHPLVSKISFTGSEDTGRRINKLAADSFKSTTLELGGKSPNIVFDDADIESAANGVVAGFVSAGGQTCVAGSRLLVQEGIYEELMERVVKVVQKVRLGDPMHPDTDMGPVANTAQHRKISDYIKLAQEEGASLLLGGGAEVEKDAIKDAIEDNKLFVEPTIFVNVSNDMKFVQEEIFGPVLAVMKFRDETEALELANDTRYGLAAGIWTTNVKRAVEFPKKLKAGTVWVNTYRMISYTTPFGGYKHSGLGKENGLEAIKQYLQEKSVWLSTEEKFENPFVIR